MNWNNFIFLGIFLGAWPLWAGSSSTIEHADLRVCTKDSAKCLVLTSEKLTGSFLKPLFMLKNPEVNIVNAKTQVTVQIFKSKSGYVDFELNRVVLSDYDLETHRLKETVIDLSDFSTLKFGEK